MSNQIVIINNESVFEEKKSFFCDNVAMKTLSEGLKQKFDVLMILRKSNAKRFHKINLDNIKLASNIFVFLFNIYKTFKQKKTTYLLVSITPYTFFSYLFLFIFRKKIFIYLRSNGYEEYKHILGIFGSLIYHFMYSIVTFKSNIITCQKRLTTKKSDLVYPSEIDVDWIVDKTKPKLDKPRLLYVGRMKVEKGIFSLIKLLKKINLDIELSIVGNSDELKESDNNVNLLGIENDVSALKKIYDDHNIFILPSFTEAHPQVIDESLARDRPVIIFKEINHVIQNKKGIFVSERNSAALSKTISFIMDNYPNIKERIKENTLPMKKDFITDINRILNK